MGKSRLVDELRQRAERTGALVATGRTPVAGASLPYGAVVALLRDLGRQLDGDPVADRLAPVRDLLLGEAPTELAHAQVARVLLFEAALQAVDGVSAGRPTVLVLEDLHWADAGSVELLDHLVRNLDRQPVLVVATFRPDEVDPDSPLRRLLAELRRLPSVDVIDLEGLSRSELAELLSATTGEEQPWTVVDAVLERSEGNPLFAEELVAVRDRSALPPAINDLLAVRIGNLGPPARQVVAAASMLGTSVPDRLLQHVAALEGPAFDDALSEAIRRGVLVLDPGAGVIRFRHALLREAAGGEVLPSERVRSHHRAAAALRTDPSIAASGPGAAAAELARHHFEAGEWAEACTASLSAADAARALFSVHAAHAHLQRAREAHRRAGGTCDHPGIDDAELLSRVAEGAHLVGAVDAAREAGAAAVAAIDPGERASSASLDTARAWRGTSRSRSTPKDPSR